MTTKAERKSRAKNGGRAVREKYGSAFYREIGRKGGLAIKERGIDYLRDLAKAGGEATKARFGREHFVALGRKGGSNGKGGTKTRTPRRVNNPA